MVISIFCGSNYDDLSFKSNIKLKVPAKTQLLNHSRAFGELNFYIFQWIFFEKKSKQKVFQKM